VGVRSAWFGRFGLNIQAWPDLLCGGCVVVLGERGTGKTEELRACADQQRRAGKAGFFLRVEEVARRGVANSLHLDDLGAYRTWNEAAADEAWFFLDAVDEATLRGSALSSALTTFAQELEPHLRRIHLVISSRASDWRSCDEDEVRRLAPHLYSPDDQAVPKLVQLGPLDENQVSALATHYGVMDVQALLQSVRDSNTWSFVERPLDIQWLSKYWIANRRLGSLRELVAFNAGERLKEKPDRPTVLSSMKAREGARDLALAAILVQRGSFRLPEDAPDPRADDSIDPRDILVDWTNAEIRELLARGLFDEATYGRVRIHHRSVQEFLAAERLAQMIGDGLPRTDLETLLFRKTSGRTVVPRHIAPVVAWLAATDREVREMAIGTMPEHLVDEGDPAALPAADRRATLSAYAARFGDREHVYHHFDSFGLKRFACTELVDTIRELLGSEDQPDHVKQTLLRIVKTGRIVELADSALEFAMAPDTSPRLRDVAIEAAAMPGPSAGRRRKQLATLVAHPAARSPDILATLVDELFPGNLDVRSLVAALVAVGPMRKDLVTGLNVLVPRLPARCGAAERSQFLELLTQEMVGSPAPDDQDQPTIKPERLWLADCLASLVAEVIKDGAPFPSIPGTSLALVCYLSGYHDSLSGYGVDHVLAENPMLRREIFWRKAAVIAARRKRFPRESWDIELLGSLEPGEKDTGWLSSDAAAKTDVRDRLLAFSCLLRVLAGTMDPDARLKFLTDLAERSDANNGTNAMKTRLQRLLNPQPSTPHPAILQMQLRQRARLIKQRALTEKNHKALGVAIERIRSGEDFNALRHLYSTCQRAQRDGRWESMSFDAITETYDGQIAEAAREGFRQFWRSRTPDRREKGEPNSTPYGCIFGLIGLGLEIEAGLDLCALPQPLLTNAVVYASWELNGFPDWLSHLSQARPDLVRATFAEALRLDFGYVPPEKNPDTGRLLWKLPLASIEVRLACAPALLDLLMAGDPPGLPALESTLEVLHSTGALTKEGATALASDRVARAAEDPPRFALWWCFWVAYDPRAAVDYLEVALHARKVPKQLAEEVCSRLWTVHDGRSALKPTALRADGPALARLIPLAYVMVRPQDDITHDGVFSPGIRDGSQDLRNSLITWLSEIPGPATVEALDRLAEHPALTDIRDWIRHMADTRAADNAGTAMSILDASKFIHSLVLEPRSTDELFAIAIGRLDDIRLHLLNDDFSVRQAYNPPKGPILEEPVQNYFAHELDLRRRGQYSVAREPEVTRRRKPDIRMYNPRCDGPVTIEVKIAERWELSDLKTALADQLVGTYMKANNSRHGVLVVCASGPSKTWKVGSGVPNVDFDGLLAMLRLVACDLKRAHGIVGLEVIGVDFH